MTRIDKVKATWLKKLMECDFETLGWDARRKRVLIEQDSKCNRCDIDEWQGEKITLEVDHINGDNKDHIRNNLEGLCPNCHSLTPTWRGRNKPRFNSEFKVSDEELLHALSECKSTRQALLSVGLAAKGNNYNRVKKLMGV